jgi:hypothetical protein
LKNLVEIVVVTGGLGTEAGSRELARGQGLARGNEDGWELEGWEPDRLGTRLEEEPEDEGQEEG